MSLSLKGNNFSFKDWTVQFYTHIIVRVIHNKIFILYFSFKRILLHFLASTIGLAFIIHC